MLNNVALEQSNDACFELHDNDCNNYTDHDTDDDAGDDIHEDMTSAELRYDLRCVACC